MGIEFRSSDVGMSEQRLHCSQVCPVLQHVSGATVPEHVRASVTHSLRTLVDDLPHPLPCKLPTLASHKKPWHYCLLCEQFSCGQPMPHGCGCRRPERHYAVLVALAADRQQPVTQIQIRKPSSYNFGRPQRTRVKQF